jgi:hypothetical protein
LQIVFLLSDRRIGHYRQLIRGIGCRRAERAEHRGFPY